MMKKIKKILMVSLLLTSTFPGFAMEMEDWEFENERAFLAPEKIKMRLTEDRKSFSHLQTLFSSPLSAECFQSPIDSLHTVINRPGYLPCMEQKRIKALMMGHVKEASAIRVKEVMRQCPQYIQKVLDQWKKTAASSLVEQLNSAPDEEGALENLGVYLAMSHSLSVFHACACWKKENIASQKTRYRSDALRACNQFLLALGLEQVEVLPSAHGRAPVNEFSQKFHEKIQKTHSIFQELEDDVKELFVLEIQLKMTPKKTELQNNITTKRDTLKQSIYQILETNAQTLTHNGFFATWIETLPKESQQSTTQKLAKDCWDFLDDKSEAISAAILSSLIVQQAEASKDNVLITQNTVEILKSFTSEFLTLGHLPFQAESAVVDPDGDLKLQATLDRLESAQAPTNIIGWIKRSLKFW